MTEGDARRESAAAANRQAGVAERREEREGGFEPWRKAGVVGGIIGSVAKGLSGLKSGKGRNHASWYMNFEDAQYFGRLSFANVADKDQLIAPNGGAQIIHYLPSIGGGNVFSSDAAQKAMLKVQQLVRKDNAGAKNYEPSDIAIRIIATGEIIAQYGELARMYGLLNYVDATNRWKKVHLLSALASSTYTDVADQAERIYFALKQARDLMASVSIPHVPYFDRVWHLAANVFEDDPKNPRRTKVIAFKRDAFGIFQNGGTYSGITGGCVHMQPICKFASGTSVHFGNIVDNISGRISALRESIDALTNSTDYITIMGDLAKAFGETVQLPEIPLDYKQDFADDPVTCTQIDNTTLLGFPIWHNGTTSGYANVSRYDIWDLDGVVAQCAPYHSTSIAADATPDGYLPPIFWSGTTTLAETAAPVDSPVPSPSEADVYVLTRNTVVTAPTNTAATYQIKLPAAVTTAGAAALECFCSKVDDSYTDLSTLNQRTLPPITAASGAGTITAATGTEFFTFAEYIMRDAVGTFYGMVRAGVSYNRTVAQAYEHKPTCIVNYTVGSANVRTYPWIANNAIAVDHTVLERLHYASVFSEFMVLSGGGSYGGGQSSKRRHTSKNKNKQGKGKGPDPKNGEGEIPPK